MSIFSDILGSLGTTFRVGLSGVTLKSNSGKLEVRNTSDTANAAAVVTTLELGSGDTVLASGGSAGTITFPSGTGSPNQALVTDGAGTLSFATVAGGNDKTVVDTTSLAFGSSSPVTCFTLPVNAVIMEVKTVVDTAFDGTPTMSVGLTGALSKYVASTQVDLNIVGSYAVYPDLAPVGVTEDLIITYAAGGSTVGAARILISYVTPS